MRTCKGEFARRDRIWFSVSIFVGIRLHRRISSGRISCVVARSVSITKIRSCKVLNAGIVLGIMIGIFDSLAGWFVGGFGFAR